MNTIKLKYLSLNSFYENEKKLLLLIVEYFIFYFFGFVPPHLFQNSGYATAAIGGAVVTWLFEFPTKRKLNI